MVGVLIVSHVVSSLALIRELVTRGHRGTYANDPLMADRIASAGAELVLCTSTLLIADNDWLADPIAAASLFLDDAVQASRNNCAPPTTTIRPTCTSTTSAPTLRATPAGAKGPQRGSGKNLGTDPAGRFRWVSGKCSRTYSTT